MLKQYLSEQLAKDMEPMYKAFGYPNMLKYTEDGKAYTQDPCYRSNCELNPCSGHCKKFHPEYDKLKISSPVSERIASKPDNVYRVYPDYTIQEEWESPYSWMSDDYVYITAKSEAEALKLFKNDE